MPSRAARLSARRASYLYSILSVITVATSLVAVPGSPASDPRTIDVRLTGVDNAESPLGDGIALVIGPTGVPFPSISFVNTVDQLYLEPLGFTGNAIALPTPELSCCTDTFVPVDAAILVAEVNPLIAKGDVSAANPIVVFGYSQSAAAASEAMNQLYAEHIPADDVHFVLVGDPASAYGGILNTGLLPSLPSWLTNLADLNKTVGLTTPDYYPTDVYTIQDDFYAGQPLTNGNVITDLLYHEAYLGLVPSLIQHIDAAPPAFMDGLVNYYTISDNDFNLESTLWNALLIAGGPVNYNDAITVFNDINAGAFSFSTLAIDAAILLSVLGI